MPEGETLNDEILQMLRLPNGEEPSIFDLFAEKEGFRAEDLVSRAQELLPCGLTGSELMKQVREEAGAFVKTLEKGQFTEKALDEGMKLSFVQKADAGWQEKLKGLGAWKRKSPIRWMGFPPSTSSPVRRGRLTPAGSPSFRRDGIFMASTQENCLRKRPGKREKSWEMRSLPSTSGTKGNIRKMWAWSSGPGPI